MLFGEVVGINDDLFIQWHPCGYRYLDVPNKNNVIIGLL